MNEYRQSIEKGLKANYDRQLFGDLMRLWIYEIMLKSKLAQSSKERYEGIYRNYLESSVLFNLKINEISSRTLQAFYSDLLFDGRSSSIVNNTHKLLKIILGYAVDEDIILKNPAKSKHINIGKSEDEKKKVEIFTDEELKKLMSNLDGHTLRPIIILALGSGMRRGEILGLMVKNVNFKSKTITVDKTLRTNKYINNDGSYYYLQETQKPKSKSSIRTIAIPDSVLVVLKEYLEDRHGLKVQDIDPESFVFKSIEGNPLNGRNVLRSYKRLLSKLGLDEKNFHCLRHTYASKLFEKGVRIKTVQTLLGHSDISITSSIYIHIMPNTLAEAASEIEDVLNGYLI